MKIDIPSQHNIIDHYGVYNQFGIHMEECAELIQAISKCQRAYSADIFDINKARTSLVEEMSDVLICIEQLQEIFNISDIELKNTIAYKLMRQTRRMREDDNK